MSSFSAVDAATEGFRLIGRKPGAVAAWVAVWLVLMGVPLVAVLALIAPHIIALVSDMGHDVDVNSAGAFARMLHFQMVAWSLAAPWLLWMLAAQAVLHGAVYRAVLEPSNSAAAYLRLGMDEVRLFLLQVVFCLLAMVFLCLLVAAGVAIFVASAQAPDGVAPWTDTLGVMLLVCLFLYVPIRLCLAGPMTFAKKRLEVFGSWRRTRGRFWPLVGMILVTTLFICVIAVVVAALRNAAIFGLDWGRLQQLRQLGDDPRVILPALLQALGPALVIGVILQAVADGLMRIVAAAPFAAAYRDIGGATAAAAGDAALAHA